MSTQWGPVIGTASVPSQPVSRRRGKALLKRKQFLIAGVILAGILAYLIYMGVRGAGMYYMSVSELLAQSETLAGQQVRVQGKVVPESIQQDASGATVRFVASDGVNALPVVYTGVVPDTFGPDSDVVMEGVLGPSGTFEATNLMAKCASKYKPL